MRRGDDDEGTHHLSPASRATACGVDCGWNDTEAHNSTPGHRHKPLLMGWKGVLREIRVHERAMRCDRDRDEEQGLRQAETRHTELQRGWGEGWGEGCFYFFVFFVL